MRNNKFIGIFGIIAVFSALVSVPQVFMDAGNKVAFWLAVFALSFLAVTAPAFDANALGLVLTPASGNPVGGQSLNLAYLSTVQVFDSFHKPIKYGELIRRLGDQGLSDFDQIMILGGGTDEQMDNTTFSVRFEDWIVGKLKVLSFTSPSASYPADANTADIVVHPDVITNGKYYAEVGDVALLPNENNAKIIAKTGTTVTLALAVAGASWGTIINGTEIGIAFTQFNEETDQPAPKVSTISEEAYDSHILKTTTRASGSELIRMPWVVKMSDGTAIPTAFAKGVLDAEYRMKQAIAGATFFSQPITNTGAYFQGARGQETQMTGLVPWIRIGGVNDTLGAGFNINKLYAMSRQFRKYYAPKEYILKMAGDAYIDVEKNLTNLFTNDPAIFAMGGSLTEKEIGFGFKSIKLDDRTWHLSRLNLVNHPEIYDLPDYSLQNRIVVMPNATTKDKKSGGNIPYLKYVFCGKDGESRKMKIWFTGGPIANTETIDRHQMNMLCEIGTRPVASNHWGMFE